MKHRCMEKTLRTFRLPNRRNIIDRPTPCRKVGRKDFRTDEMILKILTGLAPNRNCRGKKRRQIQARNFVVNWISIEATVTCWYYTSHKKFGKPQGHSETFCSLSMPSLVGGNWPKPSKLELRFHPGVGKQTQRNAIWGERVLATTISKIAETLLVSSSDFEAWVGDFGLPAAIRRY